MERQPVVNLYPLSKYKFINKVPPEKRVDASAEARITRMQLNYKKVGMRTAVEGIFLVQKCNHPYLLLLQTCGDTVFQYLPGGRLRSGENEIEGLKRKLRSTLGDNSRDFHQDWQIGECVSVWWRPNFEPYMYPYYPPHITKPKEYKKLYLVHLPEGGKIAVPTNLKLVAHPFFEIHCCEQDGVSVLYLKQYDDFNFGSIISKIPMQLSRFQFNMVRDPPNKNNDMR